MRFALPISSTAVLCSDTETIGCVVSCMEISKATRSWSWVLALSHSTESLFKSQPFCEEQSRTKL